MPPPGSLSTRRLHAVRPSVTDGGATKGNEPGCLHHHMEESGCLASLGLCLGFLLCSSLCVSGVCLSQPFPCPHYTPAFLGLQLHASYRSGVSLNVCPHSCCGPSSVYTLCRVRDPCFLLRSLTLPTAFPASLNSTQLSQSGSNLDVCPEARPGHFRKGL